MSATALPGGATGAVTGGVVWRTSVALPDAAREWGADLARAALAIPRGEQLAWTYALQRTLTLMLTVLLAIFGVLRAGLTVVNTNPMYTARELRHQLVDSGASARSTGVPTPVAKSSEAVPAAKS